MAATSSLSSSFNSSVLWGVAKFVLETIVIGFLVGGMIDITFFHDHPAGQAIIDVVKEPLLGFYDDVISLFGFPEYARNAAFVGKSGCPNPFTGEMGPC